MLLTCCVILLTLVASLVLVSHSQCTLLVFPISFYAFDDENSKYQQCVCKTCREHGLLLTCRILMVAFPKKSPQKSVKERSEHKKSWDDVIGFIKKREEARCR